MPSHSLKHPVSMAKQLKDSNGNCREGRRKEEDKETGNTYSAAETIRMPLSAERLEDRIGDGLATFHALGRESVRVTTNAPRVTILFHKGR